MLGATDLKEAATRFIDVNDVTVAIGRSDEVATVIRKRYEHLACFVGSTLLFDIDIHADPLRDFAARRPSR